MPWSYYHWPPVFSACNFLQQNPFSGGTRKGRVLSRWIGCYILTCWVQTKREPHRKTPGRLHYPLDQGLTNHSNQVKSSPSHIFVKFYHNRVLPISLHIIYGGCFCVTTFDREHVACKANNFCYLALYRTIPGPLLFLYSTAHIFTFLVAVLPGWQLNDVREVLTNAMMMIILKQTNVSNRHMVPLKLTQCYM